LSVVVTDANPFNYMRKLFSEEVIVLHKNEYNHDSIFIVLQYYMYYVRFCVQQWTTIIRLRRGKVSRRFLYNTIQLVHILRLAHTHTHTREALNVRNSTCLREIRGTKRVDQDEWSDPSRSDAKNIHYILCTTIHLYIEEKAILLITIETVEDV